MQMALALPAIAGPLSTGTIFTYPSAVFSGHLFQGHERVGVFRMKEWPQDLKAE